MRASASPATGRPAPRHHPSCPRSPGNPTVLDTDPSSLINIVLNGSAPLVVKGNPAPYRMPQYRAQLTNQQIADVVTFTRNGWGNSAPSVSASQVADQRKSTDPASDQVVILKMR
jgi:alcohol dehydrogenase (quinone), cytochrome c subunit